ncbi:hypothetical protein [Roseibium sp.]|uniref:hypothetical protein n=1 Tax=Roseibium sp. TaxID=1936156 RepID=UPI003A98164E
MSMVGFPIEPASTMKRLAVMLAIMSLAVPTAHAQDQTAPAPGNKRYALVKSGEDILRIDREAGSVSFCRKANEIWRCVPAPLAEEAYQAEIAALSDEIDQLKREIERLEQASGSDPDTTHEAAPDVAPPVAPEVTDDLPGDESEVTQPETAQPETSAPGIAEPVGPETPPASTDDESPESELSEEDEEQLEQMLQFSEKAMRRFFGLMKDLKQELKRVEGD